MVAQDGDDGVRDGVRDAGVRDAGVRDAVAEVDDLAGRVRRLPPPSWTGPASEAFEDGLARTVRLLDGAADALLRAREAARRLGAS
ncbi:hypothetical protein [Jannaschia sp. R86511]|uniref:hypothetical protein n=1 Tax=Jannaschia sp. R86511 TaxID=3093853 RepID=UPI0036D3EAEA